MGPFEGGETYIHLPYKEKIKDFLIKLDKIVRAFEEGG